MHRIELPFSFHFGTMFSGSQVLLLTLCLRIAPRHLGYIGDYLEFPGSNPGQQCVRQTPYLLNDGSSPKIALLTMGLEI